jgi:hypothetical protein
VSAQPGEPDRREDVNLAAALPGLARIAALASVRLVEWTAGAYVRAGSRLLRAAAAGEPPRDVLAQTGDELVAYLRDLLGLVEDGDARQAAAGEAGPESVEPDERPTQAWLRARGADLLQRSADVERREETHPAYARILTQLAPDEARILKLLMLQGPQPSVDVRTGGPIGIIKDELVAPGLNLIGMEAGVRYPERVQAYLNNLYRLGLIWFSREQLRDQSRYQVLEAQPEVAQALADAGRGRSVRRSIHLTAFGEDFCRTCLPAPTDPATGQPPSEHEA